MAKFTLSPEDEQVLMDCEFDTKKFSKTFFPAHFTKPFSPLIHDPIFKILDHPTSKKTLIVANRGAGKTSLARSFAAKEIVYKHAQFVMPLSCTAPAAQAESRHLMTMLKENPYIIKAFGDLEGDPWGVNSWKTSHGVMCVPKSTQQQVRGINEIFRPDLIMPDDIDNPKTINNEDVRKFNYNWFRADLENAIDEAHDYRFLFLGTPIHQDSIVARLMDNPEWEVIQLPLGTRTEKKIEIILRNGNKVEAPIYFSYWPEHMSHRALTLKAMSYALENKTHIFNMEYMAEIAYGEDAVFQRHYFKEYNERELALNDNPYIENWVIVDPARSVEKHTDFSAIVGVGLDWAHSKMYVRDIVNKRLHPDEIYMEAAQMAHRINARTIGFEETGLKEFSTQPFENYLRERGHVFALQWLHPRGNRDKAGRISALVPYYRYGSVYHNPEVCDQLEQQLLSFPRSRFDDIMDALAYVIQMMDTGNRSFFGLTEVANEDYSNIDDDEFGFMEDEPAFIREEVSLFG